MRAFVTTVQLEYLWAALCICGAVFFIFRSRFVGA
jgi:uncharacterized protein (DUF486 family)